MALATLSIDIEARLARLDADLGKATRLVQQNTADMGRALSGLKSASIAVAGPLAGVFAGFSAVDLVRSTVNGIDALNDLKDATGSSIENLSALEDVGVRTGASFETVSSSLIKFNKVLNDADPKSEAAKIIKAIGLDVETLKKLDPAEAMRQFAVGLDTFSESGEKARAIQVLLGKSTAEAAPFLKDLAEQGKLNATVTTEQALAAEKFNKILFEGQKNVLDFARNLAGPLISSLNETIAKFKEGAKQGKSFYGVIRDEQLKIVGLGGPSEQSMIERADRIRNITELLKQQNVPYDYRLGKERELSKLMAAQAASESKAGGGRGFVNPDSVKPDLIIPGDPTKPDKKTPTTRSAKAFTDYQSMIDQKVGNLLEDTDVVRAQELNDQMAKLYQLFELGLPGDLVAQAQVKLRGGAFVGPVIPPETLADMKTLNELLAATPSAQLEETRKKMLLLAAALEGGVISAEKFSEAAQTELGTLPEVLKQELDQMSEFSKQAAANIQDSLGASVKSVLTGDFDSIGERWKDLLVDMASQAIAAKLGEQLLGDYGKSGKVGGAFGSVLSYFGFANGGAFANGPVPIPFAKGDVFNRATPFKFANGSAMSNGVLGEAGPEAIMPLRRGRDGKLGVAAAGGGSVVQQTFHIGAGVTRGDVFSLMQSYGAQLKGEILQSLQNGGAFAR